MLLKVSKVAASVGLNINIWKNKAMSNVPDINSTPTTLEQSQIEVVNQLEYLGSYININSGYSKEILCCGASASAVFTQLWKLLCKWKEIYQKTKKLYLQWPSPISLTVQLWDLAVKSHQSMHPHHFWIQMTEEHTGVTSQQPNPKYDYPSTMWQQVKHHNYHSTPLLVLVWPCLPKSVWDFYKLKPTLQTSTWKEGTTWRTIQNLAQHHQIWP